MLGFSIYFLVIAFHDFTSKKARTNLINKIIFRALLIDKIDVAIEFCGFEGCSIESKRSKFIRFNF